MFDQFPFPDLDERIAIAEKLKSEGRFYGDPYCADMGCRRMDNLCIGMHCPHCGGPCGPQGHNCSQRQEAERLQNEVYDEETLEL